MKQSNLNTNATSHHKSSENFIRKKPKKEFELLYRERVQTTEQNPIQSIIFVKSKACKPKQSNRKIKVQQQFDKIMKDLDAHLVQHKINKSTEKKTFSPNSSQMKATSLSKKQTKESDFQIKKNKTIEKEPTKGVKIVNKGSDGFTKQKMQRADVNKSPKKGNNTRTSPSSKRIVSPKSPKFEKQSTSSKKFMQGKIERSKSPNQRKLGRKGNLNQTSTQEVFHNQLRDQKKVDVKRNIRQIPLKVEEYIFIEDSFELIKQKSLFKLQTKLLSTYRNDVKQFENKLGLKQNEMKKQIMCEDLEKENKRQDYLNFIEEPSVKSQQEMSEFNLDSQRQIKNFELTEQSFIIQLTVKITRIQQWWRRMLKIQQLKKHSSYLKEMRTKIISKQKVAMKKETKITVDFPSAKSITFNEQEKNHNIEHQNQQMAMLKNQNEIVIQKKTMHERILRNLLKDNKISKEEFEAKMQIVEKQYERQLKDIISLYKLCEGKTEAGEVAAAEILQVKIIQGKQLLPSNPVTEQHPLASMLNNKLTPQMQHYIQHSKGTKQPTSELQKSGLIADKYSKKTDQQGQDYYEDFQSEQSSDPSPHKALQTLNFQQFEANIDQSNSGSFQPNTNFIQMLQEFKQQQDIRNKIQQRIGVQMGVLKAEQSDVYTIDTSILGIHQFLVNFFKFYLYYYKQEFLRFINMPYGYQPEKRLKFIQGYEDQNEDLTEDDDGIIYGLEYIISDDVFDQFIVQYYGPSLKAADQKQREIIKYSQVHDKVVFQCFNEALNFFRPYYAIGGPPYAWNCSQKTLTFYFIAEQNVQEVFQKTEFKVMKWASALLGLYVQQSVEKKLHSPTQPTKLPAREQIIQNLLQSSQSRYHPIVIQNRQQRLIKQQRLQITQSMSKWNQIEEQKTSILYQLGSLMLEELVIEVVRQFLSNKQ